MNASEIIKVVQESKLFKAHPWHGVPMWANKEKNLLNVYVEVVQDDRIKFELDKESGYLKIDRPQKFSNVIPALYGFIPQTYSKEESAIVANEELNLSNLVGDEDPIDICVLTDKKIGHGDFLLEARPIGGFRMIDNGEVDDKIIAVLKEDLTYGYMQDISELPEALVNSLKHYFLTYKEIPHFDKEKAKVSIDQIYNAQKVKAVLDAATTDYKNNF